MWLDRALGRLGWDGYDDWELWQCAAKLGDADHDPVVRGSRGLTLPSDETRGSGSKRWQPKLTSNMAQRLAKLKAQVPVDLDDDA